MKAFKLFIIISALFLLPAHSYSQDLGELRVSLISGDVQIRTEDTEDWVPASINMPLREGDRIWIPQEGKLELQLRDGTYLRLDEESALEIITLDKDSLQFYLNEGHLYANFRGQTDSILQIDTSISSIRAYDPSIFMVDLSDDGLNQISVLKGSVDVEAKRGMRTVKSGYALSLDEEAYAELSPLGPPDQWERWNRERDGKLAAWRPPVRHLPEELSAYSADFDEYGKWVYTSGYGYVWTPKVVASAGWAPYRMGRWVWMAGDYVWVSYEPWGWVPYHYGRWAFVATIGWCWVPPSRGAVFWGPGFVAWVRTPTYVAWIPLAPREIYYGRGHYGPHSVNITSVNITNIQVNKIVYKNVNVKNSVTVVHNDTFVTGKHVDVHVRENPFRKERISIVGPDIRPERTTRMPVVKEVPPAKRPPEPIKEIRVRETKEKRPLVKERNASVLKPESPPREMTLKVKEGKPVQREFEKAGERSPIQKEVQKPGEMKRPETKAEKSSPVGKTIEKSQVSKELEKRGETTKQFKPSERTIERSRQPERVEKNREIKPTEKVVEKPKEPSPAEKTKEKVSQPQERTVERTRETKPPEKGTQNEKGTQKPKELRTPERGIETRQQSRPTEKGIEKQREFQPQERGTEKSRSQEKPVETFKERQSVEKETQSPVEDQPVEKRIERAKEPKGPEKRTEKNK
ncbi:MAG: DUF6600 domain-containing protein [Thermodesulfobacteriota bacterium]